MYCTNCGKQITEGAAFCAYCGQPVEPLDEVEFSSPYDSAPEPAQPEGYSAIPTPMPEPTYIAVPVRPIQNTAVQLPHAGEVNAYPAQNVSYEEPRRGSSPVLVGALSVVSVLLLVSVVLLFVKPGYLRKTDVPTSSDSDRGAVSEAVSSKSRDSDSRPYESTVTETENDYTSSEETSSVTSSKAASSKAASSKAASSKAASSKAASSKAASSKAASSKAASSKAASSKSASSKAASSKAVSSKAASSKVASSKAASSKAASSKVVSSETKPVSQYVPEPEPEPKPQPEPQPTYSEPEYTEDELAYSEAMVYSTEQRPTFDEFEWCFGQNGLVYQPPDGTTRIINDLGFSGGWKCMMIYNPSNSAGTFIRELDNVTIFVNNGIVGLTVDWYLMSNDTQAGLENEEDMEDTLFQGSSLNGGVSVTSADYNTSMIIQYFWKQDGNEYALGTMQLSDGTSAYVAMTR